jgi:hypothetical protein
VAAFIGGVLREPLLIVEVLLIVITIQASIVFFLKVLREKKTSANNMLRAWAQLIVCYAAVFIIFIIADFYVQEPDMRKIVLNISYLVAVLGSALFSFYTEREIQMKRHYFTLIMLILTGFVIFNTIFSVLSTSVYITFIVWLVFIVLIIIYIRTFTKLISDKWRLNVYSLIVGSILVILGFGATSDWMIEAFNGLAIRYVGDFLIIFGILCVSILFIGVPSLAEFDWFKKLKYLSIIHNSGVSIGHFHFNQEEGTDSKSIDDLLIAGGLTSITQLVSNITKSERKLDFVDHGDMKILFEYGKYLINVLVVEEPLVILRTKLKRVTEILEMLYSENLEHWDGDLNQFVLLEPIVNAHFKPKIEKELGKK